MKEQQKHEEKNNFSNAFFFSHSQTVNGNKIFMMQYILFYIHPTRLTLAIAILLMHYPNELLNVVNILCALRLRIAAECINRLSGKASELFFNESKVSSLLLVLLLLKRHKNVYKNGNTL